MAEPTPDYGAASVHQTAPTGEGVALAGEPRLIQVDWDKCDDCGACTKVCPTAALSPWGRSYTVAEVLERILRDRPFFERSGGGVTVSGGEPLSQAAFTLALLRACREAGLHTALDTTGFAPWGVMERTLPYTDLYLLDLKHADSEKHRQVVGVPNESILENARRLAASKARIQVRIPVIPRFNDSSEEINKLGRLIAELGEAVTLVQLLPYHALGVHKWDRIKPERPVLQAVTPSEKRVAELKAILEEYALKVQVH